MEAVFMGIGFAIGTKIVQDITTGIERFLKWLELWKK